MEDETFDDALRHTSLHLRSYEVFGIDFHQDISGAKLRTKLSERLNSIGLIIKLSNDTYKLLNPKILITQLRPRPYGEYGTGEEINIVFMASHGTGDVHSGFCSVYFNYHIG